MSAQIIRLTPRTTHAYGDFDAERPPCSVVVLPVVRVERPGESTEPDPRERRRQRRERLRRERQNTMGEIAELVTIEDLGPPLEPLRFFAIDPATYRAICEPHGGKP